MTTPRLRRTPPREGNLSQQCSHSPPVEGWTAQPDGVVFSQRSLSRPDGEVASESKKPPRPFGAPLQGRGI